MCLHVEYAHDSASKAIMTKLFCVLYTSDGGDARVPAEPTAFWQEQHLPETADTEATACAMYLDSTSK